MTELSDIDLSDIDVFHRHEHWDMFETLRREAPVHWNAEPEPNAGFWNITRYADIWAIDRDPETFTSSSFVNIEEVEDELRDARRSLLEMDGPRHTALRALVKKEFSPRMLRGYEEFLRALTKQTVDRALEKGEFDFVHEVSADFPIQVLARMLDVPTEDTGQLITWGDEFVGNTDPEMTQFRADLPESEAYKHLPFRSPTVLDVWEYGDRLKNERKGGDATDLISILANRMPSDGIPMTDNEFHQYFTLLIIAGNETTRHTISHSMLNLINNPEQLRLLQEQPELIQPAVEEMLRYASPVYHFRRTATRDVEMHGETIKEGDKVVMWFASGNRDETVFERPNEFDVTRTNVDHMTFGKGSPHLCLGNNLARLEIRLMFEELLPRIESIELAGEVDRLRSNFANGIKRLPVRVVPRAVPLPRAGDRPTPVVAPVPASTTTGVMDPAAASAVTDHFYDVSVTGVEQSADGVVTITMSAPDGSDLAHWSAGAHIDVEVPLASGPVPRQYSLCSDPHDLSTYRIGVLREPDGRGGSRWLHDELKVGDTLRIAGPLNHFKMVPDALQSIFIGGGIGITPILPMLHQASHTQADWQAYYVGHRAAGMAYKDEVSAYGEQARVLPRDDNPRLDLEALLGTPSTGTVVYACGPVSLLEAIEDTMKRAGWPSGALHTERFEAAEIDRSGDEPFDIVLERSGTRLHVPADRSVLQVVREAGVPVLGSCLEGVCGTCETEIVGADGELIHRDVVLSDEDKDSGEVMMVCVSRCGKGGTVRLDL